jgi:hypothetical protein
MRQGVKRPSESVASRINSKIDDLLQVDILCRQSKRFSGLVGIPDQGPAPDIHA